MFIFAPQKVKDAHYSIYGSCLICGGKGDPRAFPSGMDSLLGPERNDGERTFWPYGRIVIRSTAFLVNLLKPLMSMRTLFGFPERTSSD
jgi:hypothetical protein